MKKLQQATSTFNSIPGSTCLHMGHLLPAVVWYCKQPYGTLAFYSTIGKDSLELSKARTPKNNSHRYTRMCTRCTTISQDCRDSQRATSTLVVRIYRYVSKQIKYSIVPVSIYIFDSSTILLWAMFSSCLLYTSPSPRD